MRGSVMGTAVALAAGALLTAAMTTAAASPPAATAGARAPAPRPVLVDCLWHQNVRPANFILACGDGNSRLAGLHWTEWNPDRAKATGVNWVNDCTPYCAAGHFHAYAVTVRLDGPEPWKKRPSVEHFTQMTLTYDGARPPGLRQVVAFPLWD